MFRKVVKIWQNYLQKLARENEKQFGRKRIKCCDLRSEK